MIKLSSLIIGGLLLLTFLTNAQTWPTKSPNSSNPYDSVGYIHNLGVIYCRDNQLGSVSDVTLSFITSRYKNFDQYDSLVRAVSVGSNAALYDSTNYLPVGMSSSARSYISGLISLVDNISDSNETDGVTGSVKDLEADILGSDIADSEKVTLLCASSVARYRLNYWMENASYYTFNDQLERKSNEVLGISFDNNLYENCFGEVTQNVNFLQNSQMATFNYYDYKLMSKPGWLRRLLHTVIGDIVGGAAGALIGSSLGDPVYTIICGIGGAIIGSIAASNQ